MPEHNFEQQARDMANGFNMEPKPEVWQNVRNAMEQPRQKRRLVLWWWLLPLAVIGGSIVFYTFTATSPAPQVASTTTDSAQQVIADKQINPSKKQQQPYVDPKKETGKKDTAAVVDLSKGIASHQPPSVATIQYDSTVKEKQHHKTSNEPIAKVDEKKEIPGSSKAAFPNDIQTETVIKGVKKNTKDSIFSVDNRPIAEFKDNLQALPPAKDSALTSISAELNSPRMHESDSSKTPTLVLLDSKDSIALVNNPDSADNTSALSPTGKHTSKLQWGLVAEGGFAARKSSVFPVAGAEKSNNGLPSLPNSYNSGAYAGRPGSSGFRFSDNIKHGATFGLGITLQKPVNNSLDIFADVVYHYQTFHIATTAYKDSLLLNNALTSFAGSYEAKQTFHFASVLAGVNWHFINKKHFQLGVSVGADNLLMVAAKQQVNGVNSANFALSDAVEVSNNTFEKNNFYKYQPGLFAGLLINVKWNNQQLQLVPYTRSSFRPFDKQTNTNNNYLFSAGLRAVYFFK